MSLLEALILGVLHGLADVFPVSVSGHRAFVGQIFFDEIAYPANFLGAMNLATALAVLLALRGEVAEVCRSLLQGQGAGRKVGLLVLVAALPAGVVLYAFRDATAGIYADLFAVGVLLLVSGLLLYIGEELGKRTRPLESLGVAGAILVGLFQTLAVLPGISRSGAAVCGAMLAGITREAAVRFALLLSALMLIFTGLWRLLYVESEPVVGSGALLAGALAALVCGYGAARVVLALAREFSMMIYAYYLWLAGVLVILFGTVLN